MKNNPEFSIFCGPMFSGKTTRLLSELEKYRYRKKNILAFKPFIDNRYSDNEISSHNGWKQKAIIVSSGKEIIDSFDYQLSNIDVIAVDEMFMIPGSALTLINLYNSGISILISTLDLSSNLIPFEEVSKIFPFATRVEKCYSICSICGNDAYYTHRLTQEENEICVGGVNEYEARCFNHHPKLGKENGL
jgi:thymidine kinase